MSGVAPTTFPGQLARTSSFTLGLPDSFVVTPDGSAVAFLRTRGGDDRVTCLWVLDLDTGSERLVAEPVDLLGRSDGSDAAKPAAGSGLEAYATDEATGLAAFAFAGQLWTADLLDGTVARLPAAGPVVGPRPDPTGRRIAYVHDGTVRVIERDGSADREVAGPGADDNTPEFGDLTRAVSLSGPRGFWWEPGGERLLVAGVDASGVELWHLVDPTDPAASPRSVRAAAVGTANAVVTLWITGLDGSRTEVRWDRAALEYLPTAGWDSHGPYAVVQSRDQCTVRMLGIDPASGATTVLDEQRDDCWVQLVPGLPARLGSGQILSHADLLGTRHLTVGGVAVTPPGVQLRAVLGVEEDTALFTASEDPSETHLWSYRTGEGVSRLSTGGAVHTGVRRAGTLVQVARGADRPGGHVTVHHAGGAVGIASLVERPVLGLAVTQLVLGPQELRGVLHLPSWYEPGSAPLPVLLDPYGGAGLQRVTAELDWRQLVSQWFAEQGFAVLVVDGRGTPGRGPTWERSVHGDLFGPVLDDQVEALHEAGQLHRELDLGRVGIRGWSFSGALAALAVLRRPDVFQVAVAGAGVADQLLYSAHWRERFLGHPASHPERYEACSLLLEAPKLTRPLLLIHGLLDDNVHPANTLRLSHALLTAGRPHEVLLLPGVGHRAIGVPVTESLLWHQARFLQRHLGVVPRSDAT